MVVHVWGTDLTVSAKRHRRPADAAWQRPPRCPTGATVRNVSGPAPSRDSVGVEVERLDVSQLGRLVRERRGQQSLRQAALDAGVSFSTLSRVEAGAQPDLASFTRLCAWLGVPPSRFFTPVTARAVEPIEDVIAHLHADPRLRPEAAATITSVLREMYASLAMGPSPGAPLVACHLRAAPVMRPGVPGRLAMLLSDFHKVLDELVQRGDL